MALFGRDRAKGRTIGGCSCGCCADDMGKEVAVRTEEAGVKVLGSGCAKCNALEAAAKEALLQLGMEGDIDHITDPSRIAAYGVMSTPALVIDGKVVSCGKVLRADEIVKILQKVR